MNRNKKGMVCVGVALAASLAHAQEAENSLDSLLNLKVEIATKKAQTVEEAPSIVSVVTRREIESYGLRDLSDILRTLPGFELGLDVFSIEGLSSRGVWVHEGKALVMINGMSINDLGYGNTNMLASVPSSMIERVEVIRGPGSASYGGFAEVTTINVITRRPESLQGFLVSARGGYMDGGARTRGGNVSWGMKNGDYSFAAHVGMNANPMSSRTYTDFAGNSISLGKGNNSKHDWSHIILEASSKHFTLHHNSTNIDYVGQDSFAAVVPKLNGINQEELQHTLSVTELKYKTLLSEDLTLEAVASLNKGSSITAALFPASGLGLYQPFGPQVLYRYKGEVTLDYSPADFGSVQLGAGYQKDDQRAATSAKDQDPATLAGEGGFFDGSSSAFKYKASADSKYAFVQYLKQINAFGLTAAYRFEDTSYGNAAAPRMGVTYVNGAFNTKLLYAQAFRIPLPTQALTRVLHYNPLGLKPETSSTVEAEVGYRFSGNFSAKANLFYIDVKDPICFDGAAEAYLNEGKIKSYGLEAQLDYRTASYGGFANLSTSQPGSGTSPFYLSGDKKHFLASPPVKVAFGAYYKLGRHEFAPSVLWLSTRYGQSDAFGTGAVTDFDSSAKPAMLLANLNYVFHDVTKGMDLQAGVRNIFNAKYTLIQAYYGGHKEMPQGDREVYAGLDYKF